jgi:hypothetical protein
VQQSDFSDTLEEHINKPYFLKDVANQESWRQLPEIPSGTEINSDDPNHDSNDPSRPNLPEIIVKGPPESKEAHIRAQYQLLRYDAIYPLWDAVREYKICPATNDARSTLVYTNVSLSSKVL